MLSRAAAHRGGHSTVPLPAGRGSDAGWGATDGARPDVPRRCAGGAPQRAIPGPPRIFPLSSFLFSLFTVNPRPPSRVLNLNGNACPPGFGLPCIGIGRIDPCRSHRYLSQDFTCAGPIGPGGSMAYAPALEAFWSTRSSTWPLRPVSRIRPFSRVPVLPGWGPALMLSGLSELTSVT